jgi:hypothetical protein
LAAHVGDLIFPPSTMERVEALGPMDNYPIEIEGIGWRESSYDIVIPGLGWIAVTGVGKIKVNISAPRGSEIVLRPSLLPFEAKYSTAKFTGGRIEKKSRKQFRN